MKTLNLGDGLTLPLTAVTATFGLLAVRGAGKSNTAAVMAEEMFGAGLPFVVVDPVGSWYGLRSGADGAKDGGLPVPIFGGRHGDLPLERGGGELVADLVASRRLSCVLDLSAFGSEADKKAFLLAFARRLYQVNVDPLHLFLEEADDYIPQRPMRDELQLLRAFENIVRRGRARGLGMTLITQRSAVVNKNVLTQVETLFAMRTTGPQDIAAIEAWVKHHQVSGEVVRSLASLKPGEAWVWSPAFLEVMRRVQIRRRRTFDSGATPKNVTAADAPKPATLADVDLGALRGEMAATIEKAKADDPKELKRLLAQASDRLAATTKKLNDLQSTKSVTSGFANSSESGKPEVREILTDADRALLKSLADVGDALRRQWGNAAQSLAHHFHPILNELIENVAAEALKAAERDAARLAKALDGAGLKRIVEKLARLNATPERQAFISPSINPGLTRPGPTRDAMARLAQHVAGGLGLKPMHRAMLTALAQYGRLTKKKIRAYTDYADSGPVSSAFAWLVSEGFVVAAPGGLLQITDAGLRALGPFEPLPVGKALRDQVLAGSRISEMEKRFLRTLFDAYPEPMGKGELRAACGYADSGPVSSAFAHLVAIDYAVAVGRGQLRAADVFFDPR